MSELFAEGQIVFVPNAAVDCPVWAYAPVVLNESRGDPGSQVIARDAVTNRVGLGNDPAVTDGGGLGKAQEEVREVKSCAGRRIAIVEVTGAVSGKAERPAAIGIRLGIL